MIPYGFSLAAVSMIGQALGADRPAEARRICKVVLFTTSAVCLLTALVLNFSAGGLISLFTEDLVIAELAKDTFGIFVLAFAFDWVQCCACGLIKGAGLQSVGSLCSLFCLCFISLPTSYLLTFQFGFGIKGLWIGYGVSSFVLTGLYCYVLKTLDWKAVALQAAKNEVNPEEQGHADQKLSEPFLNKTLETSRMLSCLSYQGADRKIEI